MLAPKVWIPILIVLLAVIGGLFYGQQIANQPATTRFVPVATPQTPKPPPPGETHETGHWHGDYWHAVSHEPVDQIDTTDVQIADPFLDLPAETLSDLYVQGYVKKHREQYPDCQEHEAVLEDAKRFAKYVMADAEYMEKDSVLHAEWKRLHFEEYPALRKRAVEIQKIPYDLSKSERFQIAAELQAWKKKSDALDKRQEALRKEKPASPPPMHTH